MKLTAFRVFDFRSIDDSGEINVGKLTTLVGRNESGKSNLLLALQTINPSSGLTDLSKIKNFPRHRRLSECTDETTVVETTWDLEPAEQAKLAQLFPRSAGVKQVKVGRHYKATRWVTFTDLKPIPFAADEVAARVRKIVPVLEAAAEKLEEAQRDQAGTAIKTFESNLQSQTEPSAWAAVAAQSLAALRKSLASSGLSIAAKEEGLIRELQALAALIVGDPTASQAARNYVVSRLPIFVYVDEYPELSGHQDIAEYLTRKGKGTLTDGDRNFEKLCKVADLDPQQLQTLLGQNDHETRNQLANRAGAVVTSELRRLWKDRQLKVRFNLDANHLDTFISDPNSVYDVEVNLDERSRGFKWFFSFYVTFAADTKGGPAEYAVLLLDEPGLYLHMTSQADLLHHFGRDLKNQVIYTTHSPFMIPTDNLDAVRTVNIDQDDGTTVTNDPTGDPRTLFPLQAALGFYLAQNLFVGPKNLVVEGVTDYWIISCASDYLRGLGRPALPTDLTLTPAGGAQKVTYMVALLTSERLKVMVLLDDEKKSREAKDEMVKAKLIREDNVVFVSDGFAPTKPNEADIEDLLDPPVYDMLVRESYKTELSGKTLALNANIPRIAKRYESAFEAIGIEFHKTRPARLLLRMMATEPQKIMTASTVERFERLFSAVVEQLKKHLARDTAPFR